MASDSGARCPSAAKAFPNGCIQDLPASGVTPVHGVGQRGFGDRLHSKVVQPRLVGQKTVASFLQGVLSGNMRIQAGEELSPGGKMLAVAVGAVRLDVFFKMMSGYELEKLGKDGIVMHNSRQWCLKRVV